ncbi:hypothetical protein [Paracoccus sp. PAMC 22219]|nr:hypothetical protein [Paracoccus sp. PAMC 22219]
MTPLLQRAEDRVQECRADRQDRRQPRTLFGSRNLDDEIAHAD